MEGQPLRRRSLRAAAIISAALIGLTAVSLAYARPHLAALWPRGTASPPLAQVCDATFVDPRRGVVVLCSSNPSREAAVVTEDGGLSWRLVTASLVGGAHVRWFDTGHAMLAGYTATGDGLWMTADGGRSWTTRMSPPAPSPSYTAELPDFVDEGHGVNPWYLDQAAPPGLRGPASIVLWRTDDGAMTWQLAGSRGLPRQGVKQLLGFISPTVGFIAWWPPGEVGWPRLLATADGAETWAPVPVSAAASSPTAGAGISGLSARLVLWTLTPDSSLAAGSQLSTRVSDDGGRTWSDPIAGPRGQGTPLEVAGNRGLLMQDGDRLWLSVNGEDWTWRQLQPPAGVRSIRVVSGVDGTLFAAGQRKAAGSPGVLLRSDDGGRWRTLPVPGLPA